MSDLVHRTLSLVVALLILTLPGPVDAQTMLEGRIDQVFESYDRPGGPGCAVGIVQAGRLTFAKGYGEGSLDHAIPLSPRSVFYLASVSKQFAAAAIVIAEDEGHLSLDDEVRAYIPEFPDYGAPVTIRHLVHHTSGARDYLTLMSLAGIPLENVLTDEAMLGLITRQRELNFEPGSEYLYSNSGYVLLAEVVKRATGRSLRDYSEEKIFAPLGMTDTHFHDDRFEPVPGRVFSYHPREGGGWRTDYLMHFDKVGDGGLYSTVEDLAKWDAAFYDDRLGIPGFAARMYERGVLSNGDTIAYARGLMIDRYRGLDRVQHGGGLMGFRTMITRYPEQRTTVILLCNAGNASPGLSADVAELVLSDDFTAPAAETSGGPSRPGAEADRAADLETDPSRWAGTYFSEELGASFVLEAENGALVLDHPLQGRAVLRHVELGRFTRGNLEIRFVEGRPDAFVLQAGRVRNLQFQRTR